MEYSAIIHDMDKRFCYAIDKDLFVIRIQVKRDDIKEIILHYEDKYIPMEWKDTRKTIPMKKVATSQFQPTGAGDSLGGTGGQDLIP